MGQGASSGGVNTQRPQAEILELGDDVQITLKKVNVIREREVIKIPEIVVEKVPTIQYIVKQEETVQYVPKQVETTCYEVKHESTTRYEPKVEETIRYVTHDVPCEKPVIVDKLYERPVLQEKEYTLVTYKDLEAINELMVVAPKLLEELKKLKSYKLVEEVVKVQKVQFEPTTVERVVWSDVHKCKKCGALVDDN